MLKSLSTKNDLRVHEKSIFRLLFLQGSLTKKEIQQTTGGSLTTISRFLDSLVADGLVGLDESRGRAAGARPGVYAIRPSAFYSFGSFISPDGYGIGLCDSAGTVLDRHEYPLLADTQPEEVFDLFASYVTESIRSGAVDASRVSGLGVASTGPINKSKGIIFHPFHLANPEWQIVPIRDVLSLKTSIPTVVDSITETALLGEIIYGSTRSIDSAAYLWIDRGIGCAVYSHGMLGIGNIDMSASVGHTVIDFKGEICRCGKRGCLETYAAIESISGRLKSAIGEKAKDLRGRTDPSQLNVFAGAAEELELARAIVDAFPSQSAPVMEEITEALAVALANFICVTRPRVVFFDGRTASVFPLLVNNAFKRIRRMINDDSMQDIRFVESTLTSEQIIKGAALLPLNQQLEFVRNITS